MNNSKEVVILIIMILVVLVSAAKADDGLMLISENALIVTGIEYFQLNKEPVFTISMGEKKDVESSLELGVASTSSLSNLEEDYGLVVTLTTIF